MSRAPVLLIALAACGARPAPNGPAADTGDRRISVTLFRDAAMVHEKWRVDLDAGEGSVTIPVDAGIAIDDLAVLATGGARLLGLTLHGQTLAPGATVTARGTTGELVLAPCTREPIPYYEGDDLGDTRCARDLALRGTDGTVHVVDARGVVEVAAPAHGSHVLATLGGSGEAWLELVYTTPRITWTAGYALVAGDTKAVLHGAVAIENTSGIELPGAAVTVVDEALAPARRRAASDLGRALLGRESGPGPVGRELGRVDIGRGETRLELSAAPRALPLEEVLVFDPIGNRYDSAGRRPQMAPEYGLDIAPAVDVLRSFEIALDARAREGLPAGPVRLFRRGQHDELVPLGAGRLFDRAQVNAKTATIAVGRSPDVVARRKRTDFVLDGDGERLVEEFAITITNSAARATEVLVREHLYRGESWKLVYSNDPTKVSKEGPQQILFRIDVPARGETRLVYRVLYCWSDECSR